MAGLKFFVSSTCYDLSEERNQLRNLIKNLGHEPILSDHGEVLYDFDEHTHLSCVREVINADIVVLIIGTRFGGKAINDTIKLIDLEELKTNLHNSNIDIEDVFYKIQADKTLEKNREEQTKSSDKPYKAKSVGFSITHFEILKALELNIPIFVFIKDKISNFYDFYIENKYLNPELTFPDFSTYETKYLAEFIGILKSRKTNNSIFEYSSYMDIENQLKLQLALKFRNLLLNERNKKKEEQDQITQSKILTQQLEELKTVILSTLDDPKKEVARGVLKFRQLVNNISYLIKICGFLDDHEILKKISKIDQKINFTDFMKKEINVTAILADNIVETNKRKFSTNHFIFLESFSLDTPKICLRKNDFIVFKSIKIFEDIEREWNEFLNLVVNVRKEIIETLYEEGFLFVNNKCISLIDGKYEDFINKKEQISISCESFGNWGK